MNYKKLIENIRDRFELIVDFEGIGENRLSTMADLIISLISILNFANEEEQSSAMSLMLEINDEFYNIVKNTISDFKGQYNFKLKEMSK